jgi:transposase
VSDAEDVRKRFASLTPFLDERRRRLMAASEVLTGTAISVVEQATGLTQPTIRRGLEELRSEKPPDLTIEKNRRSGGGRRLEAEKQPGLYEALHELIQSAIRGDPEAALLWVSKSQRRLAEELKKLDFRVSPKLVGRLLTKMGFSLQANSKTREGAKHPDRDAQFQHINAKVQEFQAAGQPAISVDTKKKELVGDFKNGGRELRPKRQPEPVQVHDFIGELGKVAPYGVYDIARNEGFVNVGISHDTASFAVASIEQWWIALGKERYPDAKKLLITADCGGSNGARVRLWKCELQRLANKLGIAITVAHHPPGTSKWNRIEHRLFAFITKNWRGKPLVTHEVIVQLIAATTTQSGLSVQCRLDEEEYAKGIKISDMAMKAINLVVDKFHGEWNYTVYPFDADTSIVSTTNQVV